MIGKRRLIGFMMLVALTVFGVLNLDTVRLSAYESPAIYISPAYVSTEDPWSEIGNNYTFVVHTDYNDSDVWGFEFDLTFNPNVLEVIEVVNGGLINETINWYGVFNNTKGTLAVGNHFKTDPPPADPPLTEGPGPLANITFAVVGYGISNIAFVDRNTRLIGAYEEGELWIEYNIIDDSMLGHIEGSIYDNLIPGGDLNGDGNTDASDLSIFAAAYGSTPGDPNWNLGIADLNGDSVTGAKDLQILGDNWG